MRVLIIGATGFIGREVVKLLKQSGHEPVGITRDPARASKILGDDIELAMWDGLHAEGLAEIIPGAGAIINLAGENIAGGRWTLRRKDRIRESRIRTGRLLTEAVSRSGVNLPVLIQGSATGIYGTDINELTDETGQAGSGFLARLTSDWESSTGSYHKNIQRIVIIRTGLVLGKEDGLLKKMILPFHFYGGTFMGSGRQWMPWIHLRDEARAILFLLGNRNCTGPYNLVAPEPVQMDTFIFTLAETLRKPAWIRIPDIVLKAVLGEMAEETILSSQKIYPGKLLKDGFKFEFTELSPALKNLLPLK